MAPTSAQHNPRLRDKRGGLCQLDRAIAALDDATQRTDDRMGSAGRSGGGNETVVATTDGARTPVEPDGGEDGATGALDSLVALHDEVDGATRALARVHGDRLQCRRGCHACCVDELTVTRIEALRIRRAHPTLLATGAPHPVGACAFLDDEGACRIYAERPLVCRSQGLPLQLWFEDEEGELEERRDICPLNVEGGPPLEALDEDALWLVGVHELRLTVLDEAAGGGDETRVALRDLFARKD
jgi:Fe-S-cluster containining protein